MFQVIKTQRRPHANVEFASMDSSFIVAEVRAYFGNNFKKTGKCINVDISLTDNDTLYTSVMLWNTEASYNEFVSDPFLTANFFDPITTHMANNNIAFNIVSKENV